ncbi:hypothetical protein J8V57_16755, partial [Xenorhabdus sp. PB61.4]|uniref:TetR/AcrR family transcriptional regulator n=1 Tax=Xenorhabdus sp. PB61.4 TaxID=2788940 RepID=UPI00351D2332|nr:hypothetical protein [Xenorhabdus sp. PB61.4]
MYEELSPKGKAKYNQILDAVQVVICRDGIYECNHRAVAAEAGVPLGTTTYYFKTLDDMLRAALGTLFLNLCNCLFLICLIYQLKQVKRWTRNSYKPWLLS